jgi:hypothetical protein
VGERVLVRHFLRGLLDNDLISPHADRHQVLSVGVAGLITASLFVTVLMSTQYVFQPFQSPGRTALGAVNDRFLYSGWSMIVMALVAVAQWDALAIDARDASILGPLPIPHRVIVRAKLLAVALFAAGFALALNGVPILLHPTLMVAQLTVGIDVLLPLIVTHFIATMAAGTFGFLVVLGLREFLRAILGGALFVRVSILAQTALILGLVALVLLLPGLPASVGGERLSSGRGASLTAPLFWFPGLHELLAGHVIDRLPRGPLPGFALKQETRAIALYRAEQPGLREFGRTGAMAFSLIVLIVPAIYIWNSRRLPAHAVALPWKRRARLYAASEWVARQLIARHRATQAGFFFTLKVLTRSPLHRVTLAVSLAIGVAIATVILRRLDVAAVRDIADVPVNVLMIQTLLLTTLLVGFRHAVRVPAELSANWLFQLAHSGDERPYLAGVKRAAMIGAVTPLLLVLFPLHSFVLGTSVAVAHLAWGLLLALLLVDATMLGFRKLPFVAAYVPAPAGQVNPFLPLLLPVALGVTYWLGWIERLALNTENALLLFGVAGALLAALHALDGWRRRVRVAVDLNEGPSAATQRLGLSD